MKIKIVLFFIFISALSQAQTKVIAHKSHSGSNKTFSNAYKKNLFDIGHSNFGLPGGTKIVILDSVIVVRNSLTILKIRESIHTYPYKFDYKNLDKTDFKSITRMLSDSLFNDKNSVQYIKNAPPYRYPFFFANPIDSVIFVGFKRRF